MKKICGIYGIRNAVNCKWYVGSSVEIGKRWQQHKCDLNARRHMNHHLQSAWIEYGEKSFEFSILEQCSSDMLLLREDSWMEYYKSLSRDFGYNTKTANRPIFDEETRRKISEANKGKVISDETRRKISIANTGKHYHSEEFKKRLAERNKLNRPSEESKRKNAEWHRGRKLSEDHKRKISLAGIGRKMSEEAKLKLSLSQRGEKNHRFGKPNSPEQRAAHSAFLKQYWKDHPQTPEQRSAKSERVKSWWDAKKAEKARSA